MKDSKCKCKCEEKIDSEKEECVEEKVEIEEEKHKTPSIPQVAQFKRPPAFERWNNFGKWNQNNFKQVQRRAAQRWR